MAHIRRKTINGITYISIYSGGKFKKYLGREDDPQFTPDRILFELRKWKN
jgi:hypothetical protein